MRKELGDLSDKIIGLLQDPRVELRCAAALVLGAAGKGAGSARVAKALAKLLHDPDATVRRFAVEGLESLGARGLAEDLVPLLGHSDEEVRARALRLIAAEGASAEKVLVAALEGPQKAAAATLLVKVRPEALLAAIGDEHVLQLLRNELDQDAKLATRLRGAAEKILKQKRSTANALRLLGYIADPKTLGVLVKHAQSGEVAVRVAAIASMRRILSHEGVKGADVAVAQLIKYADDKDGLLARTAVDTLRAAHVPPSLAKKFTALSSAKNPDAQKLALERLPALGARSAIPKLIAAVVGADVGARDAAARSLAAAPEAAGAVAEAMMDHAGKDDGAARRLQGALRSIASHVPEKLIERMAKLAPDSAVVLDALAQVAPERHATVLFARAEKLRKDGRASDAFQSLRPLLHSSARLSDEQRFFISTLGLRINSTVDAVLLQFRQLAEEGFPVAQKLGKLKDLDLERLFTLGFHMVEAADDDSKEVGQELLEAVIARQPRGKLAGAARNKLKLAR
jgi:HEAT repeat protein